MMFEYSPITYHFESCHWFLLSSIHIVSTKRSMYSLSSLVECNSSELVFLALLQLASPAAVRRVVPKPSLCHRQPQWEEWCQNLLEKNYMWHRRIAHRVRHPPLAVSRVYRFHQPRQFPWSTGPTSSFLVWLAVPCDMEKWINGVTRLCRVAWMRRATVLHKIFSQPSLPFLDVTLGALYGLPKTKRGDS